jgi:hypothetical protein
VPVDRIVRQFGEAVKTVARQPDRRRPGAPTPRASGTAGRPPSQSAGRIIPSRANVVSLQVARTRRALAATATAPVPCGPGACTCYGVVLGGAS